MSSGIEEQPLVDQPEDQIVSKKPKRSYTRDFLLSFCDLEVCSKLPDGFDESLLSEFDETTSHGIYDRQRVGSSSLQGFRRSDYGSSAPGRGDSGSYSRGLHRWDSRSSGRSDTDTDSESGRRYGSQTRRSGQNSEHDGLLGSGSFPRPSGYAASAAVPRFRPNSNYLNKSNEPYHPPRPYKAPHTRRETNDSFNDETFGSTDSTSEDRAEEEKKRRAEFELMRKEQQKALQEKQKSNSGKVSDPFSDIVGLLGNPGDIASDTDELLKQAPQDDINKLRVTSSAPPSRPLVPPGFVNSVVDKSSTSKSLVHGDQAEPQVGKTELEESHRDMESVAQERGLSELQCETSGSSTLMSEKAPILQAADQVKTSDLSDVSEILENGDIVGLDSEVTAPKLLGETGRSTSILEKLFGNAMTRDSDGTSNLMEDRDAKTDGIWSPNSLQSKFASWFLEEDKNQNIAHSSSIHANKKPVEDIPPGNPNVLLSLIAGGEKGGSDVSDATAMGQMLPPETRLGHMTFKAASSTAEISEQFSSSTALEPKPAVLTCEDLEQSILSGIGGDGSNSQFNGHKSHVLDVKAEHPSASVDNQASQHLLSLLQRGTESNNVTLFPEKEFPRKPCDQEVRERNATDNISSGNVEGLNNSGKTLTLEALFGTAFMKELHSAQGNSVVSAGTDNPEPPGLSFLTSDHALFPSAMNEVVNGISSNDGSNAAPNDGFGKLYKAGHWSGFHDPGKEVEFSKPPAEVDSNFGRFDGGMDVHLPEEDSLISLGDPLNAKNSVLMPDSDSVGTDFLSSSSNAPVNVIDKLATLGVALKGERSMIGRQDPMLVSGPQDMVKPDFPYQNLHQQATSPLNAPQMNHGKPLFHPLDSRSAHLDPHLKFMPPDAIIHYDAPMHYQFPGNMGQPPLHHSGGLPGFDHPIPPILQQMQIGGNLPPPHLERGFPAGPPIPPHPNHNSSGYVHEHNPIQGFPFGQRHSNFGSPGMAPPSSETNNPPEAFHRLLEMELGANPKQMLPPFAGGGHSRAMYGHELDMGFRYR